MGHKALEMKGNNNNNDNDNEFIYDLNNINNMISNDIRKLILPINKELADRLYSFNIDGNELNKLDYNGVLFVTGINKDKLTSKQWDSIVEKFRLKQSVIFDPQKWLNLKQKQEQNIKALNDVKSLLANKKNPSNIKKQV